MKLNLNNLRKLNEEGQLTSFARNELPYYPDTYIEVEVSDLLNRGAELRQNFQGVSTNCLMKPNATRLWKSLENSLELIIEVI